MSDMEKSSKNGSEERFSFVADEVKVLEFWEQNQVFKQSLEQTAGGEPYVFYDGPPFATGLPHHGHLLGAVLKDVVPRYLTMQGRYVERRFGWDCHGLPIEHEIDKALGFSAQEAVERLGVKGYNDQCRGIVQRYTQEWRKTISRVGRWVDFDNDYKTMDPSFMESVWWVLKQLWEKNLVYQGEKVVPISTALGSVLSNFEAGSNYKDVQDPAVTVLFKLCDEEASLAAWTTTPWTLPSNLGLCVGSSINYLKVHDVTNDKTFYVAKDRLSAVVKKNKCEVLAEVSGNELVGREYTPLFDYFDGLKSNGAFRVFADDYVTSDSGTGIVHLAPAFGEDDNRVLKANNVFVSVCPVNMNGKFTSEVSDFEDMYVKDADKLILKKLKASGKVYSHETLVHSYPFCPRSDTPIIYRAVPSWYVRVSELRDKLVAANDQVNWVPNSIKHGRMENWLKGACDWAISRNRYWGTPIPIWVNYTTGNTLCVGSRAELAELTGEFVDDLHRENVDHLVFELEGEDGVYRRVEEVLDCWFESGSMPYAQQHYPFENKDAFSAGFPAEFIAEGLDQTRGWFYTLTVLSVALFDKPAFKNVVVNGIVLAEDGKKMSKRLKNYTPPDELMEIYGADALRLFLISGGLVKAEEQSFSDEGVKEMVRTVLLPWYNAFKFLQTYASIDSWKMPLEAPESVNTLDRWILSRLQSLKYQISTEMNKYQLYNVLPALFEFIEDLTNWYVRLNRSRFWLTEMVEEKLSAYATLYQVLYEFTLCMAPFAPFLAESLYQKLRQFKSCEVSKSVHLCAYPAVSKDLKNAELEDAFSRVQQVILLGRKKRNQARVKTKIPLRKLIVVHSDQAVLNEIKKLESYLRTELNVKVVEYAENEGDYVDVYAKPNLRILGKKLGSKLKAVKSKIDALTTEELRAFEAQGVITIDDVRLNADEVLIFREARAGTNVLSNSLISIDLDCRINDDLANEGRAREFVSRVQKLRKDQNFSVTDRITISLVADQQFLNVLHRYEDHICKETLADRIDFLESLSGGYEFDIDESNLKVLLSLAG